MGLPPAERLHFLYRTEAGTLDRAGWRSGAALLLALLTPLTLLLFPLLPYTDHDLAKQPFFVPMTVLAYGYVTIYAFAALLIAISFVNLSAKRFRALGAPAPVGLASVAPLLALFAGSAHWLQPRVAEVFPAWAVWPFDAALIAAAVWTIYALGVKDGAAAGQ
jgi:hypothetical protein